MPLPRQNEFDPGVPPAEYALADAPGAEFMDIPKAFGVGAGEGTASLGKGLLSAREPIQHAADRAAGTQAAPYAGMATAGGAMGEVLDDLGTEVGNFFKNHMSEGGKTVLDTPLYQDGHFTDSAKNPLNWPVVAAEAVGQTAPVIAASAAGGVPMATMAGFTQNAGGISEAVHSAIMSSDDNQLMQSPTFVNLFKNIDQDPQYSHYSDLQKIDLAKKQLADKVAMADLGDPKMLAANLTAAYTGDAYLGELFAGRMLSGTLAKTVGKAVVRDGGVNAGFAGISQEVQNEGMNQAGFQVNPEQGVRDQVITGGLTGIAMGGVPALVGHAREAVAARRTAATDNAGGEPAAPTDEKTEHAVDDIKEGEQEVQQGLQDLKDADAPNADVSNSAKGPENVGESTLPRGEFRSGLSPEQVADQERLATGFDDRQKFGGNGPDEFADVPAYMRAGKTVHADPDARPYHMVDAAGKNGQVKARFDDKADADIFRNAQLLDQYTRGNHPDPDESEHQAVKDWFYRMTRGVKREDAEAPKKRKRGKKSQGEDEAPKREPRSDFEAKNIFDTLMGYYQYVQDAAKDAQDGEYTAPSMADYAEHRFPDRPLQLEDKHIIFADGPARYPGEPLGDERQAGGGPEFRAGERVRPDYIPADRSGGPVRAINTIEGEAQRIFPAIEDKNIIFSGTEGTDEGQRGAAPQFEGGKTKAKHRLDRFEERVGGRQQHAALPHHELPPGKVTPPDSVNDAAKSGNGELYMRRNGKPFPSEGLARLSAPYTEAKKAGKEPEVVKVDGGYAVDVPKKKVAKPKKDEATREPEKPKRHSLDPDKTPPTDTIISNLDQHASFFRNLIEHPEAVTPDDVRAALESTVENKVPIIQALNKLTKKQLEPYSGRYVPSDVKKDRLVDNAWDSLVNDFRWLTNKGPTMVMTGRSSIEELARNAMNSISQADINDYADSVKKARAERQQRAEAFRSAIDNPQTLDDYRTLIKAKGRDSLTQQQAETYDQLLAEKQLESQKSEKAKPRVTAGFTHDGAGDELKINPIEQGKNSKTGETIYNVNLDTRLGSEKFKEAASMARQLGGGYWRSNFWFPTEEKAQQFTDWLRGGSVDHSAGDAERQQRKQEQQTERLTGSSDRLRDSAEERLNAERKVNTVKRIREAASAMDHANRDLRDAEIMQKIASGISDGSLKYLTGIQHKTQIDTLRSIARRLVYDVPNDLRDKLSYTTSDGKREWNDDVPLASRVKYARYPMLDWHPSTLFDVLGKMGDARGYKLASSELRLSQQREHGMARLPAGRKANDKLAAYLSAQAGSWPEYVAEFNRLQRAGITTRPMLRAALIELEKLSGDVPLPDIPKVQKMEMDLRKKLAWDRNAFNDFFPTPESRANWIASEADIQPGMDVLEPSAGNGVLAEAARKAGGNVDVVELASDLRDILKEKGFNVVGSDFDEFKPEKLYDRVLMNPPFSNDLDVKHVRQAYEHLKPGGKLVAIVSTMAGERNNKRNQAFREWLNELGAKEEKLPEGMFKESMNPTSVATKLITLMKPEDTKANSLVEELRSAFGPDSTYSDRRNGDALRRKVVAQMGTHDAYMFNKLIDSTYANERERAIELVERLADAGDVKFSMTQAKRNGMSVEDVQALVDEFRQDYRGNIPLEFEIYPTQEAAYGPRAKRSVYGSTIKGGYHSQPYTNERGEQRVGRIVLAAASLREHQDGRRTLRHEILGHWGLNTFTPDAKRSLLVALTKAKSDKHIGPLWESVKGLYPSLDELKQAEEVFAMAAERKQPLVGQAWAKIMSTAHKLLRKTGLIKSPITGAELQDTINAIARGIRRGELEQQIFPRTDQDQFRINEPEDALRNKGVFVYEPGNTPRQRIKSGAADLDPRGLNKKQVEDEAARFLKKWNGAGGITIQVAKDMAEAEALAGFSLPDARIHAMHLPNSGRVIMVADNLDSLSHVRAKLRHEILGHHALAEVVGPAEYDKLLRTVAAGQDSKSLKPYFDRVLDNYDDHDPWKQVEEVISHVIEDGDRGVLGRAWDRVSGAVLQALRKSGFLSDENLTAGEVRNMMRPVAERLKRVGTRSETPTSVNGDVTASFSLVGKDGLLTKPRPGETETEATQRRAKVFGKELDKTVSGIRNMSTPKLMEWLKVNGKTAGNIAAIHIWTNRQLASVYNKLMKTDYAGNYQDLQAKMEARRNRIMTSAERGIENQWSKLGKAEGSKLSDLMVDATMTRVHPDKPLAEQDRFQSLKNEQARLKSSKSGEDKEEAARRLVTVTADLNAMRENYADLHQRWNQLSPEAKDLWRDTEKWYKNSYDDLKNALVQRISDVGGDQHAALISRVREQFERSLKDGPYFPLARFGKYVVIARNGDDYIREHFETKMAARAAAEAYRKDGYTVSQTIKAKMNGTNADSAQSLGKNILDLIGKAEDGSLSKEALTDQVWQTMLELMPDSSYARHFIRRRRVKGASHDARRAFANSAFHFAHHISKIEYGHKMGAVLDDMGNEIDAAMKGDFTGVTPENLETAQRLLDELKARHEMTMNPGGDGFSNALTGLGYTYNMAMNFSSAIINATQTALIALPQLAARYGWKNATKALGMATVDYFRSADKRFKWFGKDSSWLDKDAWMSMGRSGHLAQDEIDLIKRLNDDGVISITQASSLAQRSEAAKDRLHNRLLENATVIGGQLFHNIEVANREVTALATYRLAKETAGGRLDPETAYKIASKAVYDSHFDYNSANRPRWMREGWQKVLLQFKMYAQHMFYTFGRSFEQGIRGETPEVRSAARKEFMNYMLMHTLFAGVTGLPFAVQAIFGAAAQGIHSVVSDDDAPWDPETALKNWLTDELGGFASTAITQGIFNAIGVDLHSRVGVDNLLFGFAPAGLEGRDKANYYLDEALGPVIGGVGINFANGFAKMAAGDWIGGTQAVTPAIIRNLVKAYGEGTRGVTTSSGEEVVPADEFTGFELAMQSLGFSPSRIEQAYSARSAVKDAQTELSSRRSQLLQQYFANSMNGDDNTDVLEDIQAYNRGNPTNAITGEVIVKAIRQKQKARLKKERGLALSRKDEHLRALGRFGNYDPIL